MKVNLKKPDNKDYEVIEVKKGMTLKQLADETCGDVKLDVVLARVNNQYAELIDTVKDGSTVDFLDIRTKAAEAAYQHTASFIYLKAARDILGDIPVTIANSLNQGLFSCIEEDFTEEQVGQIEARMHEIVDADMPINKEVVSAEEAIKIWESYGADEKAALIKSGHYTKRLKFYELDGYRNFFFDYMVPSTGYIKLFELRKYNHGILLRFPNANVPDRIPEYRDDTKLYEAFSQAKKWQKLLHAPYLSDLNRQIMDGNTRELILLSEALHEKRIAEIADSIARKGKRLVLVAGPSSSGKTTFTKRLCTQLRVNGLDTLYMGTDDYFKNRSETPKDENGEYNYEGLDAMDLELFNSQMNDLLDGKEVEIPSYNFVTGEKEFGKRTEKIDSGTVLVIEGIHGLNPGMTEQLDDSEKFKIYISPLTQLSIDSHNRISTADARMLRRMVRDNQFRGISAAGTLSNWKKVREGEDKNIFPYSDTADVIFNSSMTYETALLKKYAEPLLEAIQKDDPTYSDARRMLCFIRYFETIKDADLVPNNSIMREFIGGSVYAEV